MRTGSAETIAQWEIDHFHHFQDFHLTLDPENADLIMEAAPEVVEAALNRGV
jgi:hypothetical protein